MPQTNYIMVHMGRLYFLAIAAVWISVLTGGAAKAQPLQDGVSFPNPTAGVYIEPGLSFGTSAPEIVLVYPEQTVKVLDGAADRADAAVDQWEMLLLGLHMPYRVMRDHDLDGGLPKATRLLILPDAEVLSAKQKRRIRAFVERGGGLIASGRTGFFDARGAPTGPRFFSDLFGADYVTDLPPQTGIGQTLDGGTAITGGLPMGLLLNVDAPAPMGAVRPRTGKSLGPLVPYDRSAASAFSGLSFVLFGDYGTGRVVWMRFDPQDVSRMVRQQGVYQAMVVEAMAYTTRTPGIAVRPWPEGHPSAVVTAALPSAGYDVRWYPDGFSLMVDALETAHAQGTFFVNASEMSLFPKLLGRLRTAGEIALSADDDRMLLGQSLDEQLNRLSSARSALGDDRIMGIYPPGGLYDTSTLNAMRSAGLVYAALPALGRLAPGYIEVEQDLSDMPGTEGIDEGGPRVPSISVDNPEKIFTFSVPDAPASVANFDQVHHAGGLYVAPFFPENPTRMLRDVRRLKRLIAHARDANSWVTTLGQVYAWWSARAQIDLSRLNVSAENISFDITNNAKTPLTGLSVVVRPGHAVPFLPPPADGIEIRRASDGEKLTFILDTIQPGIQHITLPLVPH